MLKGSVAINESTGENEDSLLLPSTTTVANQIAAIVSNMEETSAHMSTDDKSKNCQNENESNASSECDRITSATPTATQPSTIDTKTKNNEVNNQGITTKPTTTTTTASGSSSELQIKNKRVHLLSTPANIETITDDISSTTDDIKRLKHVQVRSNSTGKLYSSSRRVSFPENNLVTGYLEPADPWAYG